MCVQAPNSSHFPEIDFASKCVKSEYPGAKPDDIGDLLCPLSNAESADVRKSIVGKTFYVGLENRPLETSANVERIVLSLSSRSALRKGRRYI